VSNKHYKYAIYLIIIITGLLFCEPVVLNDQPSRDQDATSSASIRDGLVRWPLEKAIFGSGEDHIKGEVFRITVRFTNRANIPMENTVGYIFYPEDVKPYEEKIFEKKVSKFPWIGHFVDEKKRAISFQLETVNPFDIEEYYAYFEAEKYGDFDFDFAVEWQAPGPFSYRFTSHVQDIILADSVEIGNVQPVVKQAKQAPTDESVQNQNDRPTNVIWLYLFIVSLVVIAIMCILLLVIIKSKSHDKTDNSFELSADKLHSLIEHYRKENAVISERIKILEGKDE
jgi:hypothetical protein